LEFSQETTLFRADLYVDGKKVAECKNDGLGGSTDIYAYPNMYEMLKKLRIIVKLYLHIFLNQV
jgi:hypothetical protein